MLLASTLRLLAFVTGAALATFLAVLFARKKPASPGHRLALAAILATGVWQVAGAVSLFHRAVAGNPSAPLLAILDQIAMAALAALPALVLHLAALWAEVPARAAIPAYAAIPLAWWALESGRPAWYGAWLAVALVTSAALCAWASRRAPAPVMRRYLAAIALALAAVTAAGWIGGPRSPLLAWAALGPPLVLVWFIYRYNLFGLLIRPRLIFALQVGIVLALYLLAVRRLADFAQEEFEAFGPLVELALIFAAAMIWLPLYGWMTRFLSRRSTLYAAFSQRLIEDAARILDFPKRVEFLAGEVARTFSLRRAVLATGGETPALDKLLALSRQHRTGMVHTAGAGDPEMRALLSGLGFNYLFPLWYEDRLNGLLLLDTSPRLFLDEDESILLALSGQISHSLETGRVIGEKIGLERMLANQEYLATLGRAAATLAHEVKNPLSSIKTLAQLMREDPQLERRYSRDLDFILGEVDRLNRTVRQLLSFARPTPAQEEEVDLSEVLEITVEVLAREHASAGIRIEHRVERGLRLRKAGTEALQQVILNVVLNAIQASPTGSVVLVEARAAPAGIVIAVTDEGPGIGAELRERMFEPFFTTRQKGTGLGLAIVRKNVQQMRGTIAVESPVEDGHGARITIAFPPA
jgi:signal transduction histidine kinase